MIANLITVGRILLSLCLFVLPPSTVLFSVLYLLCGVSDALDGFIARKLDTVSRLGERLDSIADLFFGFVYVVKILSQLQLPAWILVWTGLIAAAKIYGILQRSRNEGQLYIEHSMANKLTGLLIFLLPLTLRIIDVRYSAAVVCAAASFAAAEELYIRKS